MKIEDLIKPIQTDTATYHIRDADEDERHDFVVVATYPRADRSEVTLGHIDLVGQSLAFVAADYQGLSIAFGAVGLRAIASFLDILNFAGKRDALG